MKTVYVVWVLLIICSLTMCSIGSKLKKWDREANYQTSMDIIIDALIIVESHGDDRAYGKGGEIGCLQITQAVIDDVNNQQSTWQCDLTDAWSREISREICERYLSDWVLKAYINDGAPMTPETYARIWNGGPTGWRKDSTLPYWNKVKVELERK